MTTPAMSSRPGAGIAVVGSGVAGLTAAYVMSKHHHVTLFEADSRLGGHAHTHAVATPAGEIAVDSGFIVHNDRTYPLLTRLFEELGVATRDTEMSMSIRDSRTGLEYAGGKGAVGFLARPRQLLRLDYLRMLVSVRRFHRVASAFLADAEPTDATSFGEFVAAHGFSRDFVELYAVPLVSCVWSSGRSDALGFPAVHLFRFLANHGMLTIGDSPQWRTVVGGSQTYVRAIAEHLPAIRANEPVIGLRRSGDRVSVTTAAGDREFDRVVVATHADQALALLSDPTQAERELLGAFRYSTSDTVLHRDPTLLPTTPRLQSSWNFETSAGDGPPAVTYWLNRLQGFDAVAPILVSLNATHRIAPESVIAQMSYTHPVFDVAAVAAQRRLPELNSGTTAYAGAYHGWGFHEDGARAGVAAAAHFGVIW